MLDRQAEERSQQEVLKGMAHSNFCLAATGAGWGVRLQQSLMMGCIPVVIAPDVEVNHTPALDRHQPYSMLSHANADGGKVIHAALGWEGSNVRKLRTSHVA